MTSSPPDTPEPEDTARLARAALAGDRASFTLLHERLAPALLTWAELRISPKLRPWLEPLDLVQEVWLRSLRALPGFDPDSTSFRYWTFRIAKNVLLEAVRRANSPLNCRQASSAESRHFSLDQAPDSVTAVSLRFVRSQSRADFAEWLEGLEQQDQDLVIHLGLEGMTSPQVAVMLDLEPKTVAKRWQRLRQRLERQGTLLEILGES